MVANHDSFELTIKQAAELVHRDPGTVRRWVRSGRLPYTRIGPTVLLDRDDVLNLVAHFDQPEMLPLPPDWQRTHSGATMPNVVAAIQRSRSGH